MSKTVRLIVALVAFNLMLAGFVFAMDCLASVRPVWAVLVIANYILAWVSLMARLALWTGIIRLEKPRNVRLYEHD